MLRDIERYLERCALDEADNRPTSLAEHDAKYHPDGFKDGDSCKFREERAKVDGVDLIEGEKKVKGGGQVHTCPSFHGETSEAFIDKLSDADKKNFADFMEKLATKPLMQSVCAQEYERTTGQKCHLPDDGTFRIPNKLAKWCEETFAKALANRDEFDRATMDLDDGAEQRSLIKLQAARDRLKRHDISDIERADALTVVRTAANLNLNDRSMMEAKGQWTEDTKDRTKIDARRKMRIKESLKEGLNSFEDYAYDQDKKQEIFKTIDNAPYEFVLQAFASHPSFHFINGEEGWCDNFGHIQIGFGEWTFNGWVVAHECGHNILNKRGQKSNDIILPEFQPIADALAEDYQALDIPELGPSMHNDTILSSDEYMFMRNEVKRLSLLRTMEEPDFDAMVDVNGEKVLEVSHDEVHEYATITDTLCAATNGVLFCGHSQRYYQSGAAKPLHETVANATAAMVMGWKTFPKVFPRTFAAVKKIVYGIND